MIVAWASRRTTLGWIITALALCSAQPTSAQVPWGLGRWQGEGTFFLDWENQDDKRAQTKYETILFQERLHLRNTGAFIVDPRFLTLNFGGSFGLSQEDGLAVTDNPLRVGNGQLYDYAFDGLFFSNAAYPVTLFANRTQTTLSQGFGGRSDVTFESRGGIFELREDSVLKDYGLLNFTSLLDVRQELLTEDSAVFNSPFRRDETRNIVRYNAHKGGETSDVDLRYELNDVTDPLNPTDVFDSHTVRAAHSIDFGPTLNRRLDSIVYYFTRTGNAPGSYLSVDEGLHLDHYRDLATDYRYNFSQSDSDAGVTTTNAASIGLVHQLYHQLTTTLNARGVRQDFPTGVKTIYSGQAGFDYRRPLLWSGQFFANTSAAYQVDDNNFTSSHIDVSSEPHAAPSQLGAGAGFTLNNPFVVNATISIVDVTNSRRTVLPSAYYITQEGSSTKISFPDPGPGPCSPTTSRVCPDDQLEVSYTYTVSPALKYSTATVDAKVGVDFPWVATFYEHVMSNQTRLSGTPTPQFLINQNLDRFELELRRQWDEMRAQSSVAYELLNSTIVDSRAWRFGQLFAYQPRPDLVAQISGDQYFVDYPGEGRRSNSYLVRGTVDWFTPVGLSVSTFAGYREFHDTAIPSDEIVDCGVRVHWTYQNVDVSPSVTWTDYRTRLNDVRGELRITRHLF